MKPLSQIQRFRQQRTKLTYAKDALRKRLRVLRLLPKLSRANVDEVETIKMMLAKIKRQLNNLSADRHKPIF